jgi:hypothetical protein
MVHCFQLMSHFKKEDNMTYKSTIQDGNSLITRQNVLLSQYTHHRLRHLFCNHKLCFGYKLIAA